VVYRIEFHIISVFNVDKCKQHTNGKL